MKNLAIAIVIATMFSLHLSAQQNLKNFALTASPYQAFTQNGELQFGFEKQQSANKAFELNVGFRFKGSDDPQLSPYFNQTLVSSKVGTVHRGLGFFLFIPIPIFERDKDWTEKTEHREYYTNHNVYVTGGMKYYLLPTKNRRVAGGLYVTPGLTIGNRGISEYVYAEGQKGYLETLASNWTPGDPNPWGLALGTGFVGTVKVMQEDIYDFTRLEIKQHNKNYLKPHAKLGFQLPIGSSFSADLGVQASFNDRFSFHTTGSYLSLEPTVKLGYWL